MKVLAGFRRRLHRPQLGVASAALLGLSAMPAAAELLDPTPLILKDGRIASVSVHTLPFERGASALDSRASRDLQGLTVAMATDCFLTAQVIGHVGSDEVEASDTLGAHRLARSRADAVQASLIDSGLPAKSIASVWDWQFMVLEARATLWVFRLTEGEDCEGKALEGVSGALLAAAGSRDEAPRDTTTRPAAASAQAAASGTNGSSIRPGVAGSATDAMARATGPASPGLAPATDAPAAAEPPSPPATGTVRAPSPLPDTSVAERTRPAGSDRSAESTASTRPLPTIAPAPKAAQAAPVRQVVTRSEPEPAAGDGEPLAIVFATNSSYFPAGTDDRLATMLRGLEQGRRYRVDVVASVSGTSSVVGASSPDEAARYNKWLAERRLDRVRDWFAANARDKELIIEPEYRSGDDSRKVVIAISPAETS